MKYRLMKIINNIKKFLISIKEYIKKYILENRKLAIIMIIVLFIVLGILIMANNKSEQGNISGNLNNSGFSVEKNGWVYYLGLKNSNTDGIYKTKLNTDKKQKLNSDYGLYLNESGKFLYYLDFLEGKYNVVKTNLNGENKEILIEDVDVAKITVVDNWIYYFKDFNFYRAGTNGKERQILSKKVIENYEISGNWIYYSYVNNGKNVIAKMKTNGENIEKIDDNSAKTFFIKNKNIYYICENYNKDEHEYNYELYKMKTNGKHKEKIVNLGSNVQLENVNFDGENIYYVKINDNDVLAIYSIKINGKNEKKIVEIQGQSTLINIHKNWIYYTDEDDNGNSQMFRVKINGKERQNLSL
jgi:hypothetical protein